MFPNPLGITEDVQPFTYPNTNMPLEQYQDHATTTLSFDPYLCFQNITLLLRVDSSVFL